MGPVFVKGNLNFADDDIQYFKQIAFNQNHLKDEDGIKFDFVKSKTWSITNIPGKLLDVLDQTFNQNNIWDLELYQPLQVRYLDLIKYNSDSFLNWHVDTDESQVLTSPFYGEHKLDTFAYDYGLLNKLSITICLSDITDYEGGEFEIFDTRSGEIVHSEKLNKYEFIMFPSAVAHRVKTLTSGERWALATWAKGPVYNT